MTFESKKLSVLHHEEEPAIQEPEQPRQNPHDTPNRRDTIIAIDGMVDQFLELKE